MNSKRRLLAWDDAAEWELESQLADLEALVRRWSQLGEHFPADGAAVPAVSEAVEDASAKLFHQIVSLCTRISAFSNTSNAALRAKAAAVLALLPEAGEDVSTDMARSLCEDILRDDASTAAGCGC